MPLLLLLGGVDESEERCEHAVDALTTIADLVVLPLTIAAVMLCFLKGRRAAWAGVAMLCIGAPHAGRQKNPEAR